MSVKRITVYRNGSSGDGKVLRLTDTLESLIELASDKLKIEAKLFFNCQGGEIDDIILIRDEDVLYVSSGESFITPECPCYIKKEKLFQDCGKNLVSTLPTISFPDSDWLLLNVGGKHFATTRTTLRTKEPNSMLARMIASEDSDLLCPSSVDNHGAFLIDRSPVYFEPILNYLRHGQLILDETISQEGVLEEAKFFGMDRLVELLEKMMKENLAKLSQDAPLTRRDVVNALIVTQSSAELRFQGVNLSRADLSKLDLRFINFKYANFHKAKLMGANLNYCCLERADFSEANIEGASFLGVRMLCANLERANLRSCNFEDPAGNRANLEGVNLKSANLEGSQMAGVNLRVATLKHADLKNCDLRAAVLAGADLENCDLSGSDLHDANLRGANLKDAAFELMLTPLHMAQAIR